MKRSIWTMLSILGVLLTISTSVSAHGSNWWHNYPQSWRDQLIVNTGYEDLGTWGGQCKAWIQGDVVLNASGGHVYLPANQPAPNDFMWQNDNNGHVVGMNALLENVQVGWIVQMKLKNGTPHTAIIVGKSSQGVNFLDSNWVAPNIVGTHFMTYNEFYSKLYRTWSYSVYYVK